MENTVTMSLEKYDEMKRKIELQDDELRFLGSCGNDGLVKVTCTGLFGNKSYEFRDSDTAVNEINKKMQDERDQFKSECDQLKSEFNRVQKTARIALAVCASLVIYCVFLLLT